MTSPRTRGGRACAAVALAAALSIPTAAVAWAHDAVIGGSPADGATVEEFPKEITLEFSGVPQSSFNTVAVSDQDSGQVLFSGQPELDQQYVTLPVPADVHPGPGTYVVGFQITSSDGHATRGKTTFTVTGGAAAKDSAAASGDSAADSSAPGTSVPAGDSSQESAQQPAKSQKKGNGMLSLALGLGVAVAIGGGYAAYSRSSRKR